MNYFNLFFTPELWEICTNQTNLHARALDLHTKVRIGQAAWSDVDVVEMKRFVGVVMVMGMLKVPDIRMYWGRDPLFFSSIVADSFSQNRFLDIFALFI